MAIENSIITTAGYTYFPGPTSAGVPAGESWAITTILVCNTLAADPSGSNDRNFSVHAGVNPQAEGNTNLIINAQNVEGADTFIMDSEKIILEAGDRLSFTQNGGSPGLSVTVSYIIV